MKKSCLLDYFGYVTGELFSKEMPVSKERFCWRFHFVRVSNLVLFDFVVSTTL